MFRVSSHRTLRCFVKSKELFSHNPNKSFDVPHRVFSSPSFSRYERATNSSLRHKLQPQIISTPFVRSSVNIFQQTVRINSKNNSLGTLSYFSSSQFPNNNKGGNRWTRGAGLLGAGGMVLLGKGKYLLGALKLTKLASLGSMFVTIGAYSVFFGLPYAVGVVGLITVHECGHALVMLQRGIPFSPMVFMPFMGASIAMNRRPRDAWEDALVAFGGPVLGSLGAGAVAIGGHMTESQLLFALADFGFMVNMFNLLPLGSMDGGRIAGALSPWSHVVGLGVGGTLAWTGAIHNPIFYLILLAGGWQTYQRFFDPHALPPGYYNITRTQRVAIGLGYVGLAGGLALAMDMNERFKKPPEVLEREKALEKHWDARYQ